MVPESPSRQNSSPPEPAKMRPSERWTVTMSAPFSFVLQISVPLAASTVTTCPPTPMIKAPDLISSSSSVVRVERRLSPNQET
jgi:hypothetical protein